MVNIKYWTNAKTRMCSMTTGPIDLAEMARDGYVQTTEELMEAFRADTKKLIAAGWNVGSPRALKKYLHVLEAEQ